MQRGEEGDAVERRGTARGVLVMAVVAALSLSACNKRDTTASGASGSGTGSTAR